MATFEGVSGRRGRGNGAVALAAIALVAGDEFVTVGRVELPVDRRFENPGGGGPGRGARPSGPMRQTPRAPHEGALRPGGDGQRGGPGGMPMGLLEPNRIFDLAIDGEPLLIVEWKRGLQG